MKREQIVQELPPPAARRDNDALYARLRTAIRIDMMRIDEALIEQPSNIMDCGEAVAFASNARDAAARGVKEAEARAADELRSTLIEPIAEPDDPERDPPAKKTIAAPKRRSEKQIETELPEHPLVKRSQSRLEDAKLDFALWMTLMDALRAKKDSLDTISRLVISGYLSPDSIRAVRRGKPPHA